MGNRQLAKATRDSNASSQIDFTSGRKDDDFVRPQERKSVWVDKLTELVNAVEQGRAEYGTYYKLGDFIAASGARNTIRNVTNMAHRLPNAAISLQSHPVKNINGGRGSELWAAVLPE